MKTEGQTTAGAAMRRWASGPAGERAFLFAVAAVLLVQLLVGQPIGLADNGDFDRMLGWFGLQHSASTYPDKFFLYVDPVYVRSPDLPAFDLTFPSSSVLFLAAARALSPVFDGVPLHLEWMAALYVGAFLLALRALVRVTRPLARVARVALLALLALIFLDVAYVSFFASVYSEPAALVFLLGAVAAGLAWSLSGYRSRGASLAFVALVLLVITAKPQYASLAVPVGIFLPLVAVDHKRLLAACGVGLVLAGGLCYALIPDNMRGANVYQSVYAGILVSTDDPQAALAELGLPASFLRYQGTSAYGPTSALETPGDREVFLDTVSHGDIVGYYVSHPGEVLTLMSRGAGMLPELRTGLGNFQQRDGRGPATRSESFDGWSDVRATVLGALPAPVLLAGYLALVAGCVTLAVRRWRTRGVLPLVALAAVLSLAQFGTVLAGNGDIDFVKQLFLGNALLDLVLVACAVKAVTLVSGFRGTRRATSPAVPRSPALAGAAS